MSYNTRVFRQQGGSEFSVASGGSINAVIGAQLGLVKDATTGGTAYPVFKMGNNIFWYAAGSPGSPISSGSPGDLMLIANSASTSFWMNVSDGTAGSNWSAVNHGAGSQTVSGP